MKQIKKVVLKEATKLSQEEMKNVFGGSGSTGGGGGLCSTSCRTKESIILKSGPTKNCKVKTIRKFCSGTAWHHAICVSPVQSGLHLLNQ